MTPTNFPGSNRIFGPPEGMTESQVKPIHAFISTVEGGPLDGAEQITVAWKPTIDEMRDILDGSPIYLSCINGLPPHHMFTRKQTEETK